MQAGKYRGRQAACAALFALSCAGGPAKDPDLTPAEQAGTLALGAPLMNELACDGAGGDCNDWFSVAVAEAGTLEVTVTAAAGQGAGVPLTLTLADENQLPLAVSQSNGRARFGVRFTVKPPRAFVWLSAKGSTQGTLGYQVEAQLRAGALGDVGTDIDPTAPRLCLRVAASPRANFHSGQPHVVRLVIYPLESALAFGQASDESLLAGTKPKGAAGESIDVRVVPGETRSLTDPLPANARSLGIIADYFRAPGAAAGQRRATVTASCARGEIQLQLDESEIRLP